MSKEIAKTGEDESLKFQNVGVLFSKDPTTKHIILPEGMSFKEGIYWLNKIAEEEKRIFVYSHTFKGWAMLDAMWALYRALVKLHGFAHVADFPPEGFWKPKSTPPEMITIEIDYKKTQQIPWGPIEVNALSGKLTPSLTLADGQPALHISAEIKNNERHIADSLIKEAVSLLETDSIYRGKAIEVDFTEVNPRDFKFDPMRAPKFWDVSGSSESDVILSDAVHRMIKTGVWTPIRKAQVARENKIPLRRGVLLAGKYGVGKSLIAKITASVAVENKWTFLYLKDLNHLKAALYFAKRYQPCVVFAEDINRITSGERDAKMDELLNVMDGVDRKNDEVMVVFTTNEPEKIHKGVLRPGRIDNIIVVTPPDAKAAERLIRLYGRKMLAEDEDLGPVGKMLAGQIPAIIREAVERSKLSAIADTEEGYQIVVRADHLITAAHECLQHAEYLKEPTAPKPDLQVLGEAMGSVIAAGMRANAGVEGGDGEVNGLAATHLLDQAGRPDDAPPPLAG